MQIEVFTMCDGAQTYSGKAVIMGSFNQVKTKKLPLIMQNLTLAVRIAFEKNEMGDKLFNFTIKNPDGSLLIPELRCEAKQNVPIEKQGPITSYDLNIVLGNIAFHQYGGYTITMTYKSKDYVLKFFVLEG